MNPLLSLLVKLEHITKQNADDIQDYAEEKKVPIAQALVESGIAGDSNKVLEVTAMGLNIEFIHLNDVDIDKEAANRLDVNQARRLPAIPLYELNGALVVATPIELVKSLQFKDDLRKMTQHPVINLVAATRKDIASAVDRVFRADAEIEALATATTKDNTFSPDSADDLSNGAIPDEIEEESEVIRFVDLILNQGISDKASDIHFDAEEKRYLIRYRVDGVLYDMAEAPRAMMPNIVSRIKIMASLDISKRHIPQDGRLSVTTGDRRRINLRVATLPAVWGEKIVLRVLDNSAASLSLEDLGFSDTNLEAFRAASKKSYGMVLVTGPTGSGKSTTLYSALNTIKTPEINIITVEEPVEYQIEGITQIPVNKDRGLGFDTVLKTVLRADPDVILVGEIRDPETAKIAMQAGMTGHLVFSTLHTNNAASAVTRLGEMGVEPFITATTVEAVVAQRLVRRLCTKCKQSYTPTASELDSVGFEWDKDTLPTLYQPVGCKQCNHTGYRGRLGIHEVLTLSEAIQEAIIDGHKAIQINRMAISEGMVPIKIDGLRKVAKGLTSIEEVMRVVV